jgi:hypothetical protein
MDARIDLPGWFGWMTTLAIPPGEEQQIVLPWHFAGFFQASFMALTT